MTLDVAITACHIAPECCRVLWIQHQVDKVRNYITVFITFYYYFLNCSEGSVSLFSLIVLILYSLASKDQMCIFLPQLGVCFHGYTENKKLVALSHLGSKN